MRPTLDLTALSDSDWEDLAANKFISVEQAGYQFAIIIPQSFDLDVSLPRVDDLIITYHRLGASIPPGLGD